MKHDNNKLAHTYKYYTSVVNFHNEAERDSIMMKILQRQIL